MAYYSLFSSYKNVVVNICTEKKMRENEGGCDVREGLGNDSVTMRTPSWGGFFECALLIFILPFKCKTPPVLWMYDLNVIFIIQHNFQPLLFNLWTDLEDFYPALFSFYSFVYHSNLNVVGWWLSQNLASLFPELSFPEILHFENH